MESSFDQEVHPRHPAPPPHSLGGQRDGKISPMEQIICSCSGAFVTSFLTTPLDVLKVRQQAQQKMTPLSTSCFQVKRSGSLIESLCLCTHCNGYMYNLKRSIHPVVAAAKPQLYKGSREIFVNLIRREGVGSLWSGLPATMVMAVPATVVYFTVYDRLKYRMGYLESDMSTLHIPMLAGCVARVCAATLISPLELVRTKMQSTRLSYRELQHAIRISVRNNGLLVLMRGLGPSLLRDVPFSALYWLGYESTKVYYMRRYNTKDPGAMTIFFAGALSGTIAAVLTAPFDVVKTHRQMELGEAAMHRSKRIVSTVGLIKDLYASRGMSALFAGIVPRVLKVAPACAIMITVYELGKSFFRNRKEDPIHYSSKLPSSSSPM